AGCRKRLSDPQKLPRPDRREGRFSRGRREGGQAGRKAGDAGDGQGRRAAQSHVARQTSAPVGAAGDAAGMEDRVRAWRREGLARPDASTVTTRKTVGPGYPSAVGTGARLKHSAL